MSTNYERQCYLMSSISIVDVVRLIDYVKSLSSFVPEGNKLLDERELYTEAFLTLIKWCKTDKRCPRCNHKLFLSDLPGYDYVCEKCDENFCECEVK